MAEILIGLLVPGLFVAMLGLLIAAAVWTMVRAQKRYRQRVVALSAWARGVGWTYVENEPPLTGRYRGEPFGRGYDRRAQHVLRGTHRGRVFVAFEHQYTVQQGKSSTTYQHTIVAIPTPNQRPYLQIGLEHAGHKLLELVGVRDLQLESEEFNRVFQIKTGSERFAYDVLHPRMMQWLLADRRSRVVPFRFEGADLLCWSDGELEPQHVLWMADYLVDLAKRVPEFVWK